MHVVARGPCLPQVHSDASDEKRSAHSARSWDATQCAQSTCAQKSPSAHTAALSVSSHERKNGTNTAPRKHAPR